MDITHRYIRLRKSYILRLVFITLLFGLSNGQKTYMRACDCEYMVDGKCAYTLFLPISNINGAQIGETCSQKGIDNKTIHEQTTRIVAVETTLDRFKGNVSDLAHLTLKNAQFLIDLQSKVISLQHLVIMNESYWLSEKRTKPNSQDPTDGSQAKNDTIFQEKYNQIVNQLNSHQSTINTAMAKLDSVENSVLTIQDKYNTLSNSLKVVENNVNNLLTSQTETKTLLNAQQEEIGNLRSAIDLYKYEGALCKKKGLIVSGGSRFIPDPQMNVSSMYNENHGPNRARLFIQGSPGSWCPAEPLTDYEWLQFDLGTPKVIYGVVTMGRSDYSQWVTSYKIQYTDEWVGDDSWTTYTNVISVDMVFPGNTDSNSPVTHMLWQPIKARYIRFVPLTAYLDSNKCMRADVIGCLDNDL